ncbi:hypothetical protein AAEO50_18390 [Rossellomorea oryzaecorticis]|uniref:Glycosyltransferase RgtA/B/C/D-like domain-containing protein n=1 Tax=Rossellomorea oryzaecorticis TaxID=1396505 RepID=A0ABU9KDR4_9BACI
MTNDNQLKRWMMAAAGLFLAYAAYKLYLLPSYASSWDEVDYALGVLEFDVLKMQPHFPGYPFYILGGMLLHVFIEDPIRSLQAFNTILWISSILPVFWLFRNYLCKKKAIIAVVLLFSLSYPGIMMVQPMSEGAAISILWWYLWSLHRAVTLNTKDAAVLPIVFFSLLLGIRLSYIAFGLGFIYYWYRFWIEHEEFNSKTRTVLYHLLLIVISQGVWVSALAANTGSLNTLMQIAFGFTGGHFTEWGGAAGSESNVLQRTGTYLFTNIFWNGLFSQSVLIMTISILLFILAFKHLKGLRWKNIDRGTLLILVCFSSYLLWGLLAQNIDKPRHILPLALLLGFFLIGTWLREVTKVIRGLLILWLMFHMGTGLKALKEYDATPPAVYQSAAFFSEKNDDSPIMVYTWEETRIFAYLDVDFSHKRVLTYSQFLQDIKHTGKDIYITNRVVNGFKQQGVDLGERIIEVGSFHSQEMFDPVYSTIKVYKWKEKKGEKP